MADPSLRSLSACLRCRRLKCKSSGAECQFVQPRAVARAGNALEATTAVASFDQAEHFSRLESQIAQLTGVVEGLRSDLSILNGKHPEGSSNHNGQHPHSLDAARTQTSPDQTATFDWSPTIPRGDLVSKGIVSEPECAELFDAFLTCCNDTIAILGAITEPLDVVRREPVLLAAVCTIGARASFNKPEIYRKCLAEANSLVTSLTFGPQPTLMALKGVILLSAWHRSDRLWGMVLTLAYEMGLQKDALRLSQSAVEMTQAEIERARTWLSIFCFELMAKTYRPYLIDNIEQYVDLPQDLLTSPYSRPVDQRIMAYLQLLKILVESRKHPLNELSSIAQEAQLISLNESLDTWFHRVHNSIDPLYQTFSKPQERNRLIIPYAFTRLYINSLVLDTVLVSETPRNPEIFATSAIAAAIDAAFLLLSTALDSKSLTKSLYYTIDYSSNTLTAALSFLHRVVNTKPSTGIEIDVPAVLGLFDRAKNAFEVAGATSYANWMTCLMDDITSLPYA